MYGKLIAAGLIASAAAGPVSSFTTSYVPASTSSTASSYAVASAKPNPVLSPAGVEDLLNSASNVAQFTKLNADIAAGTASLVFDFNPAANPGVKAGAGGQVDLANQATFPMLANADVSMATIFFEACGLNTPHIHPRANEIFQVVTDNKFTTGFVLETGLTSEETTTLTKFQGTLFPQGSIHWQLNNDCSPAVAVAALSSADPGASDMARNYVNATNPDIVLASLGFPQQLTPANFAALKASIPAPLAKGVQDCYSRCGMKY